MNIILCMCVNLGIRIANYILKKIFKIIFHIPRIFKRILQAIVAAGILAVIIFSVYLIYITWLIFNKIYIEDVVTVYYLVFAIDEIVLDHILYLLKFYYKLYPSYFNKN